VHGGRDLREGSVDNMWRLDLDSVLRATEDSSYPVVWEPIQYRGARTPGCISHHKCAVIGDKMLLIGGIKGGDISSNTDVWTFDLKTNTWDTIKQVSGDVPTEGFDDHTMVQGGADGKSIIVFGGFAGGSRTNQVRIATLNGSSLTW
jgi:hypothetical protein